MAEHQAAGAAADAGKKKSLSKVKIGAIVGVIVAVQCVLAYLYLPGGESTAKADAKKDAAHAKQDKDKGDKDDSAADARADQREVDLGKFSLTTFDANSNTTMLIDFHLFGAVVVEHDDHEAKGEAAHGHGGKEEKGAAEEDNSTFGKLFHKTKNRFRDQVIVIMRNAQMSDLADPSLGLIKRQILAKTNSLFGEPVLKDVFFCDFAVVQQ